MGPGGSCAGPGRHGSGFIHRPRGFRARIPHRSGIRRVSVSGARAGRHNGEPGSVLRHVIRRGTLRRYRLTHPVSACVQSLRARIAHAPSSSPTATAPSVPNPARGGGGGRRAPHRRSSPHRSDSFLLSSSPHRVSEIGRDLHAFCSPSDGDDVLFSSAPFLQRAGSSSLLAHNFLQTKTSTRSVAQAAVVRPWRALTLPARCSATACSS